MVQSIQGMRIVHPVLPSHKDDTGYKKAQDQGEQSTPSRPAAQPGFRADASITGSNTIAAAFATQLIASNLKMIGHPTFSSVNRPTDALRAYHITRRNSMSSHPDTSVMAIY